MNNQTKITKALLDVNLPSTFNKQLAICQQNKQHYENQANSKFFKSWNAAWWGLILYSFYSEP